MPKYTQQLVVFLDILGFSQMLPEFEKEALINDDGMSPNYHESIRLNKLVDIFKNSIELIQKRDCEYYLFSDNICMTISYIENETEKPDLLMEILVLISLLMSEFVKEGYFLRGAVDAGWFTDGSDIAVGMPLANAYKLETKTAIYPRVLLSENFQGLVKAYLDAGKLNDYSAFLADNYLKRDDNTQFLNPFFYITNFEEKESKIEYLKTYSDQIKEKLNRYGAIEDIAIKYRWLKVEFNKFIDIYIENDAYKVMDNEDLEYTAQEIATIKTFKI